ncbi:MAG: pyruvate ferredoxin oxidoreductase [Thermodesulfobacteriota bacterium]|nr:pyruvate ferredoxin oxidoreductase [Thermodesulfobacteriota bacterium]
MHRIESGNTAAAMGVRLSRAQVIAAYPITPQTPLTEKLAEYIEAGDMQAEYIPVESEHSAMAVCIAAASAGARAFTATSANGLLYMHEQIHWAAGARLPVVMCVVNRGVGAPWTVWNDHQDSMSQRDTGWIQIYVNDHQQIIDTVIKAFCLAEETSIPVMVCYDGYLLSHTYMPFDMPDQDKADRFLKPFEPEYALDPKMPANLNTVTLPETRMNIHGIESPGYMEFRARLQEDFMGAIDSVARIETQFSRIFGRFCDPYVEKYRMEDADTVAVSIGSLSYQFRDVVDALRAGGSKVGCMGVRLYRPFPSRAVAEALGAARKVAVFEKALSYGYQGPLHTDILGALYASKDRPAVYGHILGLGGRKIRTPDLVDAMKKVLAKPVGSQVRDEPMEWIGLKL